MGSRGNCQEGEPCDRHTVLGVHGANAAWG